MEPKLKAKIKRLLRCIFFKIFLSDGCWHSIDKVRKRNVIVERTRGGKVRVTSPALGSDDLSLDQSGMSIQILPEPELVT